MNFIIELNAVLIDCYIFDSGCTARSQNFGSHFLPRDYLDILKISSFNGFILTVMKITYSMHSREPGNEDQSDVALASCGYLIDFTYG